MNNHSNLENTDQYGEDHVGSSSQTPLRADAFEISDSEKIESIKKDVNSILTTLGLDLTDDSLKGTPNRESTRRPNMNNTPCSPFKIYLVDGDFFTVNGLFFIVILLFVYI